MSDKLFIGDPPTDRGPIVGIPKDDLDKMKRRIKELEAENERLWDALGVYANKLEEHEIECPVLSGKLKGESKE